MTHEGLRAKFIDAIIKKTALQANARGMSKEGHRAMVEGMEYHGKKIAALTGDALIACALNWSAARDLDIEVPAEMVAAADLIANWGALSDDPSEQN